MSTIYLVFPNPSIYLIFPNLPSTSFFVSPCDYVLAGKLSVFLLRKRFRFLAFSKNSVPIPHQMFYSETVVSALFFNARIFLPHFKISLLSPKTAQNCLTNGLLAPHTTIQVPLYTTPYHYLFHCTHHNHHYPFAIHPILSLTSSVTSTISLSVLYSTGVLCLRVTSVYFYFTRGKYKENLFLCPTHFQGARNQGLS